VIVKLFVTLLIASFVALDFYLWDYLQTLLTKREQAIQQSVTSSKRMTRKLKVGGSHGASEVEVGE
jgi:hypothetical protein